MSVNQTDLDNHITEEDEIIEEFAQHRSSQRRDLEPIIFLSYIDDETNEEIDITSIEKSFSLLMRWRLEDAQRIAALEKQVASLERASYRMATDMNGGA